MSSVQSQVRSVHHACKGGLRLPMPLSRRDQSVEPLRKHLLGVDALGLGSSGEAGRVATLGEACCPWTVGYCPLQDVQRASALTRQGRLGARNSCPESRPVTPMETHTSGHP